MREKLDEFLQELSDSQNVAGGGSAAALTGSVATSLTLKVLNNEKDKSRHVDERENIEKSIHSLEAMRARFVELISEDVEALQPLIDAYKLPKESEEEKERRFGTIQEGIEKAGQPQVEIIEMLIQLFDQVQFILRLEPTGQIVTNLAESLLFSQSALQVAHIGALTNYREVADEEKQRERLGHINQLLTVGTQRSTYFYQAVTTYLNTGQWDQPELPTQ